MYTQVSRSPLTPLGKGGKLLKVPLLKGDLGGSNPKFRSLVKIGVHLSSQEGEFNTLITDNCSLITD
ncbi:MAG: hypothetical protein GC158_00670 [Cyanobacteria bacterium RI_101]|nr:hypothetical protein [Cyanobacteria bacterium RI_101]